MTELENHHLTTTIIITLLGNNNLWILKPMSENIIFLKDICGVYYKITDMNLSKTLISWKIEKKIKELFQVKRD